MVTPLSVVDYWDNGTAQYGPNTGAHSIDPGPESVGLGWLARLNAR
jgi:hypothetical protein